ncbi:MAG: hypothetical protein HC843_04680 [Sphingomonadales bacterium]|nr:hypothetical protein [Sphingomonadales bacterium]
MLFPDRYLAGAIQTFFSQDYLRNNATGVITGSIDLGALDDVLENAGAINGNVFLRNGNDSFRQFVGGSFTGIADGGDGTDALTIDFTGGGLFSQALLNRFVNFETTTFTGDGTITTAGPFTLNTITLTNSNLTFGAGQTLQTAGPIAITGGTGANSFTNFGTVNGAIVNVATDNQAGGTINIGGSVTTNAGFTNAAATSTLNVNSGTFGVNGALMNAGVINVANGAGLSNSGIANTATGSINLAQGGTLTGNITSDGTISNQGTIQGAVQNSAVFNNLSTATVTGLLANQSGTTTNAGTLEGGAVVAGGNLNNSGTITQIDNFAAGNVANLNGGIVTTLNNAGTASNAGTIGAVVNAGGSFANSGIVTGTVANSGAFNNLAGGSTGTFINSGSANNVGTIASLTNTAGVFNNTGVVSGSTVNTAMLNTAGELGGGLTNNAVVNAAGGAMNGSVVNNAGAVINIDGIVTSNSTYSNAANGATLNVRSGSYTIGGLLTNNGNIVIESGASLTDLAGITNNAGGTIIINNGGTITDDLNNSGLIRNSGTYNANVNNSGSGAGIVNEAAGVWNGNLLTNIADATTWNQGRWNGNASNTATLVNGANAIWAGNLNNQAAGSIANGGAIQGTVNNASSFNNVTGGTVSGLLTNGGGTTINSGALNGGILISGGTVISTGNITTVNNQSGGTFGNDVGGTTGAITNAGTAANAGTVASLVNNGGTFNNMGVITGTTNVAAGTLTNSGVLAGGLTNTGVVNANGGALNGAVVNNDGGIINISGTVTGNSSFTNAGPNAVVNLNSGILAVNGTISNSGVLNFNGAQIAALALNNLATGRINGSIAFGNNTTQFNNLGMVMGGLAFGSADDELTINSSTGFGGAVNAGSGNDLLIIATGGSDLAPVEMNLSTFSGFERTRYNSGTTALSGNYSTVLFDVVGGRLFGRLGSSITANTITVGAGSTFGSAGTVNANLVVNGILSPGASPGTMTINGTVALASGSTTLFEFTPAAFDQLLISGGLSIASGATLTLSGTRQFTPGITDLITANGGISGSYGTINIPSSVAGFIIQTANRISLVGEFEALSTFNRQTSTAVAYMNSVLAAGQPNPELLEALPAFITSNGKANEAAFATLHPEAYASASHIGTENGLNISKALRGASLLADDGREGGYTFAIGIADQSKLRGSNSVGTSRAKMEGLGILGGIGFAKESYTIAGFVGHLDSKQNLTNHSANTNADGIIAGISGRYASGGFELGATLAYDGGKATTNRALFNATAATSTYKLRSYLADISFGYEVPVGDNWALTPRAGYTHVSTNRGSTVERGADVFNLAVDSQSYKADFVDASINFAALDTSKKFQPRIGFGVRHQLNEDGAIRTATGGFVGLPLQMTLFGATRSRTQMTANLGFDWRLSEAVALFANYDGDYGNGATGHNLGLGIKIGF